MLCGNFFLLVQLSIMKSIWFAFTPILCQNMLVPLNAGDVQQHYKKLACSLSLSKTVWEWSLQVHSLKLVCRLCKHVYAKDMQLILHIV